MWRLEYVNPWSIDMWALVWAVHLFMSPWSELSIYLWAPGLSCPSICEPLVWAVHLFVSPWSELSICLWAPGLSCPSICEPLIWAVHLFVSPWSELSIYMWAPDLSCPSITLYDPLHFPSSTGCEHICCPRLCF